MNDDLVYADSIIKKEAIAVAQLSNCLNENFLKAVELCRKCTGSIITSGTGKSGFVAQKLAATIGSLGLSSWWLHPNDAEHGDIGKITKNDIGLLFSNSGESKEIISLAERMLAKNCQIITIVGRANSTLYRIATVPIHIGNIEEAGVIKHIPTSSTTAAMAIGDALALTIAGNNFDLQVFASNHPGGTIGMRLSKVTNIMRRGDECPIITEESSIMDAIFAITAANAGAAIVVDNFNILVGIMTDGDLRRFTKNGGDPKGAIVRYCMTKNPFAITADKIVEDALLTFKQHEIGELPVVDDTMHPIGIINIKDLAKLL